MFSLCSSLSSLSYFLPPPSRTELVPSPPPPINLLTPAAVRRFLPRAPSSPRPPPPPHTSPSLARTFPGRNQPSIAGRHGSAAGAPPLRVDPLLRSSSGQINPGNGFVVSSSTFPTPSPPFSPWFPHRSAATCRTRAPPHTQVRIIRHRIGSYDPTLFLCTKFTLEIPRFGSSGLASDHPELINSKKDSLAGSSGIGSDHPISTDLQCL